VGFVAQGGLGGIVGRSADEFGAADAVPAAGAPGEADIPEEVAGTGREEPETWSAYYTLNDEGAARSAASASPAPAPQEQGGDDGGALGESGLALIVRDGSMTVVIPDGSFETRFRRLFEIAAANGGFVLSSETRGDAAGGVVLRIPAENFDRAIVQIRALGDVAASQVKGTDVTGEYIDLQARLSILKARRTALLTILAEADTLGQILAVQNRVDDVQFEIEKIQGRLRYLDDQVTESTLRVDMREERDQEQRLTQDDEVDNPSLGRAFELALQGSMNVLATMIVGIGYLVPLAVVGLAIWGVVRLARRRDRAAS
jgi:hypothetical protein